MQLKILLILLVVKFYFSKISVCAPIKKVVPPPDAFDFMRKYGYIPDDYDNSAALFTEEGLENVIREIQKFGGLKQTGYWNKETLMLIKQPRCGVPDVIRLNPVIKRFKRFVLGPQGWNKRSLTYFIANWSGKLSEEIVYRNISTALETWGRYARLTFSRVYNPYHADIVVSFGRGYHGDTYPFDGPGNILAHAFFPYEYQTLGGDIHFDDDENWTVNKSSDYGINFYQVALHELGHSLGLSHSHSPSAVMFPYYIGTNGPNDLDYDDVLGMYELYIRRKFDDESYASTISTNFPFSTTTSSYDFETEMSRTISTTTYFYPTLTEPNFTTSEKDTDFDSSTDLTTNDVSTTTDWYSMRTENDTTEYSTNNYDISSMANEITTFSTLPDVCAGNYDAIATLRNELFIFKEDYVWRLRSPYEILPGYPVLFRTIFPTFSPGIRRIDAAYERPDGHILFFTGSLYWIHNGFDFVEQSPLPLTNLGLPGTLTNLDAVMNWARNGKTYFFRGNVFWRYNEEIMRMDPGYPKTMDLWRGVPAHIDAATTFRGVTYFFKHRCYWKFNNEWIVTTKSSPLPAPQTWFGCPKEEQEYCIPRENKWEWELE